MVRWTAASTASPWPTAPGSAPTSGGLVAWFADHQLDDGGWNCEWEDGSTRSSFHSTLNALDGLLYREEHGPEGVRMRHLRAPAEEYLLARRLRRRLSTGAVVAPWVDELGYPFRWRYDVLRAADYFRRAAALDGRAPDPRLAEAVEVLRAKQQPDGTWRQEVHHTGREWFPVDVPPGEPSPWLTLYGARVLRWWDAHTV